MNQEPIQQELPFTKVPNIFFDVWVNTLGLVEIRIVAAIIRRTFGWHRVLSNPLSVNELSAIVKRDRKQVITALGRLLEYGIVNRSRISRQEAFAYGLIMRPEFQPLREAPPPILQKVLPYDVHDFSSGKNATTEPVENLEENFSEVAKTPPLRGGKNATTEPRVLSCIKEIRSKETHTHGAPVEISARKAVCVGSQFDKQVIRGYAWAQHNYMMRWNRCYPQQQIGGIRNPDGWAKTAHKTGDHDAEIQQWLDNPSQFEFAVM